MTPKHKKEDAPKRSLPVSPNPDLFPAGLAVFELGARPELKYCNKELPKLFGCSEEAFWERANDLFMPKMRSASFRQAVEKAAETGEKLETVFVAEKSDASAMWLFVSVAASKSGKKTVCSAVVYDITLQRSTIRKLNAECEKNRLLRACYAALTFEYDPMADLLILDSADNRIPAREFRGFISRFPQSELIHREDRAAFYWWLSLKEKTAESSLRFRADFDGSGYRAYNGTMAVICDKYGTPYHCTGVFQAE